MAMHRNLLAASVLAAVLLFSPRETAAPALTSADFNPGPVIVQDCQPHRLTAWSNATGRTVRLAAVDLWMGLYRGAFADITIVLYRMSDGAQMASLRQDRYADPAGPHQRYVSFAPQAFELGAGDGLWLDGLNCHVGGIASPMHPQVLFYFEK